MKYFSYKYRNFFKKILKKFLNKTEDNKAKNCKETEDN